MRYILFPFLFFFCFSLYPHSSFRYLLDEKIKNMVCSNSGNYTSPKETSLAKYVESLNFKENGARNLVISLLTTKKVSNVTDLLKDVIIWIFMLVLAVIILLSKFIIFFITYSLAFLYLLLYSWMLLF